MDGVLKSYDTHVVKPGEKIEFSVKFSNFLTNLIAAEIVANNSLLFKVLKCLTNGINATLASICTDVAFRYHLSIGNDIARSNLWRVPIQRC